MTSCSPLSIAVGRYQVLTVRLRTLLYYDPPRPHLRIDPHNAMFLPRLDHDDRISRQGYGLTLNLYVLIATPCRLNQIPQIAI